MKSIFSFFLFVLLFFPILVLAEESSLDNDEPKIGLVLSGGGAAGIAHIGVLKVLEEVNFPIDIVTGTSMGSVIGALYAIGYSVDEIEQIILQADWRNLFSDEISREFIPLEEKLLEKEYLISLPADNLNIRLPIGAISGHHITNLFTRMTSPVHDVDDFSKLPRPFQAIATDLETGEMVVLDSGFLPLAMRASMSIPSAFNPVFIDDKLLIDGGLKRNLPVQNAIDMGASFTISVDASSDLKPIDNIKGFNDVLAQTIAITILPNMEEQRQLSNFHLAPDLADFDISSFNEVKALIDRGEEEARKYYDELKHLADSLNQRKPSYSAPESISLSDDKFYLTKFNIDGVEGIFASVVESAMEIEPGLITLDDLERGINNLHGMRFFDKAYYKIDSPGDTSSVTLFVRERDHNTFNLGLRYDNWTRTSIILNLRTGGVFSPFSTWRFTGKLGEELTFQSQFLTYSNTRPKFALYALTSYNLSNFDIIKSNSRVSNVESEILNMDFMFGPLYSEGFMFATGYRWNLYQQKTVIGSSDLDRNWQQTHHVFAQFFSDNYNRKAFPTSGVHFLARSSWPIPFLDYALQYSHHFLDLNTYTKINDFNSLILGLYAGQTFGSEIPLHEHFYLGTFDNFAGFRRHGLRGEGVLAITAGLQYNFFDSLYLIGKFNIGNTYSKIYEPEIVDDLKPGWGLSLGWDSVIGPVHFTTMGNVDDPFFVEIRAGFNF